MSATPKEFKEIETFLAIARTVEAFATCQTVYELFGITDQNAPFASIEVRIDEFVEKYQAFAHNKKYKDFVVKLKENIDKIKRVLSDDDRDEYNNYLMDNNPIIQTSLFF